jgi:GT2 family glycosyltransferase
MGFPATVNRGMNKVKTPYALILNSDVTLEPDVISILEGELDNSRRTAIAAPMLLFAEGSQYGPTDKIQHVGMAFNVFGQPIHLFVGWSVTNSRAVQRRDTLSCVTGACMMVRYSIWKEIGGFSLNYGRGTYEDVEFCVLAKVKGHDIVVNPLAVGHHLVGQSSAVGNEPFSLQMNEQIFRLRVGQLIRNDDILFW